MIDGTGRVTVPSAGDGATSLLQVTAQRSCDGRVFDLLARAQHLIGYREGWLRLVALGPPVLDALDHR
jgi:hypothetical protein